MVLSFPALALIFMILGHTPAAARWQHCPDPALPLPSLGCALGNGPLCVQMMSSFSSLPSSQKQRML